MSPKFSVPARKYVTALTSIATLLWWMVIPAHGYTLNYTNGSASVAMRWPNKTIKIALSSSLFTPSPNIKAGSDVPRALRNALKRWTDATGIEFIETPAEGSSISPAGNGDGLSLITIADTPENRAVFDNADRTGRTRVFYDPQTGLINEADIAINPSTSFSTDGTPGTYDLEATFTHEIGHVVGLEHSSEAGSAMQSRQGINGLYEQNALNTRELSQDDIAGVRALYDRPESFATIIGTMTDSGGLPVGSEHVWIEESATGKVIAGTVGGTDGSYRIDGIPAGQYRIISERAQRDPALVQVSSGRSVRRDLEMPTDSSTLQPRLFGRNGHLSTISIPLERGKRIRILIGGDGLDDVAGSGVSVTSPFIKVNPGSLTLQSGIDYDRPIIAFDVEVKRSAQPGDYSIRLRSNSGEIAYVPGALTIEAPDRETVPHQSLESHGAIVGMFAVVDAMLEVLIAR